MSDKCDHPSFTLSLAFAEAGGYSTHYIRTDTFFVRSA